MTKTLEKMLQKIGTWSRERQNDVVDVLRAMEEQGAEPYKLSKSELAGVERGLADMRRGNFASPKEVSEMFKRYGV